MAQSNVGSFYNFPWIRPSDFLRAMARSGDFKRLLGGKTIHQAQATLKIFWKRYQSIYPHHEIFESKRDCLQQCLPLFCHGDEGTGYKKKGTLVICFQSIFGHGGRHAPNQQDCCFKTYIYIACFFEGPFVQRHPRKFNLTTWFGNM